MTYTILAKKTVTMGMACLGAIHAVLDMLKPRFQICFCLLSPAGVGVTPTRYLLIDHIGLKYKLTNKQTKTKKWIETNVPLYVQLVDDLCNTLSASVI